MAVTEQGRHHLHLRLDQVLGSEEATTLMEHPPPVGWADVATTSDLASLQESLTGRIDRLELATDARFALVDQRFDVIDRRLGVVDQRFEAIDQRFQRIEDRLAEIERQMAQVIATLGMLLGLVDQLAKAPKEMDDRWHATLRTMLTTQVALYTVTCAIIGVLLAITR